MRKKALLAFAFASGILSSQLSALAEPTAESNNSMVERIANCAQITPGERAYYLLNIADSLIAGTKRSQLEEQYKPMFSGKTDYWLRLNKNWESGLASWAKRIEAEGRSSNQTGAKSQPASPENMALADKAIKLSLAELDKEAADSSAKLHLSTIASQLGKKVIETSDKLLKETSPDSIEKLTPEDVKSPPNVGAEFTSESDLTRKDGLKRGDVFEGIDGNRAESQLQLPPSR